MLKREKEAILKKPHFDAILSLRDRTTTMAPE